MASNIERMGSGEYTLNIDSNRYYNAFKVTISHQGAAQYGINEITIPSGVIRKDE